MMMRIGFIGLIAGAVAALLFASVASGAWLSIPLFYLAPLPILIAALGWSHWAALIATAIAGIGLAAIFGEMFVFAFMTGVGIPAWWLGYLTMLARPAANNAGPGGTANGAVLEWYPPGRLVAWTAGLAAATVILAIPNFGTDAESFRAGLRGALMHVLGAQAVTTDSAPGDNLSRLLDLLVDAVPPAAAVVATIASLANLWLAGRIVGLSGQLRRPWPQLSALTLPRALLAALAASAVLIFAGGLLGVIGTICTASMLIAYAALGLAVLHALTLGRDSRILILGSVYASIVVFGWPVLALSALGLLEAAFHLRARMQNRRGPPHLTA